jgi:hypothetical protein
MKNINILPTDKPSRLYIDNKGKYSLDIGQIDWKKHQNLFITSDEEIKMGDYYYNQRLNQVFQAIRKSGYNTVDREFKIILTTDQDLIKDGVHAIDDEFLEWFVQNSSCDFVEVIKGISYRLDEFYDSYKIIIPKKNFYCGDKFDYDEQCLEQCETCVDKKGVDYGYLPKEESKLIECYFTPKKDTSSATICDNCGEEKFLHNIGEGVKISNYINIPK